MTKIVIRWYNGSGEYSSREITTLDDLSARVQRNGQWISAWNGIVATARLSTGETARAYLKK